MPNHGKLQPVSQPPTLLKDITLLFTDIEASTATIEQRGDREWLAILAAHNRIVRRRAAEFGGVESSALGDGFLLAFGSLELALRCAAAIHRDLRGQATAHPAREINVRIGVHTGDILLAADESLVGRDVHLAARVVEQAKGGEILVTSAALERGTVPSSIDVASDGNFDLRGLRGPHELHQALWS